MPPSQAVSRRGLPLTGVRASDSGGPWRIVIAVAQALNGAHSG